MLIRLTIPSSLAIFVEISCVVCWCFSFVVKFKFTYQPRSASDVAPCQEAGFKRLLSFTKPGIDSASRAFVECSILLRLRYLRYANTHGTLAPSGPRECEDNLQHQENVFVFV